MTDRYYIEKFAPPIIGGVVSCVLFYFQADQYLDYKFIGGKALDMSFVVFGFILTILTLLIQKDNNFKEKQLYKRLIKFNKRLVYLSLTLGVYCFFLISLFDYLNANCLIIYSFIPFWFFISWVMIDSYLFINIFYRLALNSGI